MVENDIFRITPCDVLSTLPSKLCAALVPTFVKSKDGANLRFDSRDDELMNLDEIARLDDFSGKIQLRFQIVSAEICTMSAEILLDLSRLLDFDSSVRHFEIRTKLRESTRSLFSHNPDCTLHNTS